MQGSQMNFNKRSELYPDIVTTFNFDKVETRSSRAIDGTLKVVKSKACVTVEDMGKLVKNVLRLNNADFAMLADAQKMEA